MKQYTIQRKTKVPKKQDSNGSFLFLLPKGCTTDDDDDDEITILRNLCRRTPEYQKLGTLK